MTDPGRACSCGYDDELRLHHEILMRAWDVQLHDDVLDIGCGGGQTTREIARLARAGTVLGVDISAAAIARARELARAQGLGNVTFDCADAQVHRFPPARFDLAVSRFGVMFFDAPAAAFANIAKALRPGGRLVAMVWQAAERNEWEVTIRGSLSGPDALLASAPPGGDAFSFADPPAVADILRDAGFDDITFTDVREPVYYGPDVDTALDWIRGFACISQTLGRLDPAAAAGALQPLREALAAHLDDSGVWFDSRSWLIAARRTHSTNSRPLVRTPRA